MAASAPVSSDAHQQDPLRKRLRQLAHRWLPLMLRRAGVANRCCMLLQDPGVDEAELLVRLKVVRDAALLAGAGAWTNHERQIAELAESAAAIAGQLGLSLELIDQDREATTRCLDRAGDQLVSLLVVGPGSDGPSTAAIAMVVPPPRSWWARLRLWVSAEMGGRKLERRR